MSTIGRIFDWNHNTWMLIVDYFRKLLYPKSLIAIIITLAVMVTLAWPLEWKKHLSTWSSSHFTSSAASSSSTPYMKCSRMIAGSLLGGQYRQEIIEFYDDSSLKNQEEASTQVYSSHQQNEEDYLIGIQVFNMTVTGTDDDTSAVRHSSPFHPLCRTNVSPNYTWSLMCLPDYEEHMKDKVEVAGVESYSLFGLSSDFLTNLGISSDPSWGDNMCSELKKLKCIVLVPPKSYLFSSIMVQYFGRMYDFFIYMRKSLLYAALVLFFCL